MLSSAPVLAVEFKTPSGVVDVGTFCVDASGTPASSTRQEAAASRDRASSLRQSSEFAARA
jgi:hypothetical protein